MKIWGWTFFILAAFNVLLLTTYFGKKGLIKETFDELRQEPEVYDFQEASERISYDFLRYNYRSDSSVNFELARKSERLDKLIAGLEEFYEGDEVEFFTLKKGVKQSKKDSLWTAVKEYRKAVDLIVARAAAKHQKFRDHFPRITRVISMFRESGDQRKLKTFQAGLDSSLHVLFGNVYVDIRDDQRLNNMLEYVQKEANPARDLHMSDCLRQFDNLFVSQNKVQWYGKYYALDELTAADQRTLFRRAVLAKYRIDRNLER